MFKTRLISGIILVIVLIATVGTGGNVLFGLLAVVSLIGLTELYKVIEVQNKLLGFAGYLATVAYYVLLYTGNLQYMTLFTIVFLVLVMAVYVFTFPNYRSEQVMTVFFGVFYVAVMLSYIYQTRMLEDGGIVVWLIFLSSWGCDTCAILCWYASWKAQDGTKTQPKEICRRWYWWRTGGCAFRSVICISCESVGRSTGKSSGIRNHLRSRWNDFTGWRSGCFCNQKKS